MRSIITGQDHIIGPWICERIKQSYTEGTVTIGYEKDGKIIAGVLYEGYNGKSVAMHVAGEGNWLSREYLWAVFHYPFEVLKAEKILGLVSSANEKAMKLDIGLGFVHEATVKDACKDGDLNILTMTRDQCRWLSIGGGNGQCTRRGNR